MAPLARTLTVAALFSIAAASPVAKVQSVSTTTKPVTGTAAGAPISTGGWQVTTMASNSPQVTNRPFNGMGKINVVDNSNKTVGCLNSKMELVSQNSSRAASSSSQNSKRHLGQHEFKRVAGTKTAGKPTGTGHTGTGFLPTGTAGPIIPISTNIPGGNSCATFNGTQGAPVESPMGGNDGGVIHLSTSSGQCGVIGDTGNASASIPPLTCGGAVVSGFTTRNTQEGPAAKSGATPLCDMYSGSCQYAKSSNSSDGAGALSGTVQMDAYILTWETTTK